MIKTRALEWAAVIAVVFACGFVHAQNEAGLSTPAVQAGSAAPSTLQRVPRTTRPRMMPQGKPISVDELLAGLTLSDDEKSKIAQVRNDMRARMEAVVRDKNENIDQKQAMLQGLQHMELRNVYMLLTPDQRIEVRKKVAAQREAEQQSAQKNQPESQPK